MTPVTPAQLFAILVFVAVFLGVNLGFWLWCNRQRRDRLTLAVEDERDRDDTADDLTIALDNREARFVVADYGRMAALPEALYEEPLNRSAGHPTQKGEQSDPHRELAAWIWDDARQERRADR